MEDSGTTDVQLSKMKQEGASNLKTPAPWPTVVRLLKSLVPTLLYGNL
jgi:hypothetical protein